MMIARSIPSLVLTAALCMVMPANADESLRPVGSQSSTVIRAGGDWGTTRQSMARGGQRWNVDALRSHDNQIRGRIAVSGATLFDAANVEARLSGRGVSGTLLDDEGKELAEFEGRVTRSGASGTYRDRTGGEGEWKWEGPLRGADR